MDQAEVLDDEHHPIDSTVEAFKSLNLSDKRNLHAVAKLCAERGNLASADELISEAYVRVAEGDRRWSTKDTFLAFLKGVVRSLASDRAFRTDARKIQALKGGFSVVEIDDLPVVADTSDSAALVQKVLIEEMWAHLEQRFSGDDEMQLLIMGLQSNLKGKDLEDAVEVDTLRLAALRTRFRRELDKFIAARCAKEGRSDD